MKEIKAIIQPFMLDKVLDALHEVAGIPGCVVSRVETHGRTAGVEVDARAAQSTKVKLEIVVADRLVEQVVKLIQSHAYTGNKGDGKIFVIECVDAMAIRTGDRGEKAL